MIRDYSVYLADILECIDLIISYLTNESAETFENNVMLQDAVYRRFEIIGEASSRISPAFKNQYPNVEWTIMKAMRNKIAHEYFGIKTDIVFETVHQKLPPLRLKLSTIQADLNQA